MDHSGMLVMLPFDLRVRLGMPWGRPDAVSGHGWITLSHHFSPSAYILNMSFRKHIVEGVTGARASLEFSEHLTLCTSSWLIAQVLMTLETGPLHCQCHVCAPVLSSAE